MTKTFKTTFTNKMTGEKVEIISKITDRMEERGTFHKRAYAVEKAHREFEKKYKRCTEFEGKTVLMWTDITEEVL